MLPPVDIEGRESDAGGTARGQQGTWIAALDADHAFPGRDAGMGLKHAMFGKRINNRRDPFHAAFNRHFSFLRS
jgi:hypothetical protein